MRGLSGHGIFCDYLGVTCNPEHSFVEPLLSLLRDHLVCEVESYDSKTLVRFSGQFGVSALVRFDLNFHRRVDRVLFGGASLDVLRSAGLLSYVVQELAAVPHNVTRLDVALDVTLSSPSEYAPELSRIQALGHAGNLRLSRKAIRPHVVTPIIKPRALDSVLSGSVMLGHRVDRYSGIVYDKTAQLHEKHGVIIAKNVLRYEMRSTEASLRDVLDGDELFFSMASPDLLGCPPGISPWQKIDLAPMNLEPLPTLSSWQKIQRIIDFSPDVERLVDLLAESSPATIQMAQRKLNERIDSRLRSGESWVQKSA